MSERKVLNKYYPPDFDPSKIPKLKLPKDRQYVVRLMAPFNMRCKTCGEYIYKGKKFNARKETVQNESYLGLPIFRFYIKCTRCLAEITFKTDPENTDYTMEHGATRNFQAEKLLEEEEKRVQKEREDEELNNPMKVLENRTKDSKLEMEVLENLQELKDLNQRQAHVDFEAMLRQHRLSEEEQRKHEQAEDEREAAALVEESRKRRLLEDSDSEEEDAPTQPQQAFLPNPTAILDEAPKAKRKAESWERSVGTFGNSPQLSGLVVVKKTDLGRSIQRGGVLPTPDTSPSLQVGSWTSAPRWLCRRCSVCVALRTPGRWRIRVRSARRGGKSRLPGQASLCLRALVLWPRSRALNPGPQFPVLEDAYDNGTNLVGPRRVWGLIP
ncbi:splicing factor YJU2 isoform X2 [Mesoplodon densirostris]|uniref:splicing factor YJU2 isoform X2 n=1 Tax=Mesoplodon densirostris TaxID=48708 RepID=UPI0028DC39D9|nr:splicing factor YJU2 isoform X2 [Mesoplodon densirostris]